MITKTFPDNALVLQLQKELKEGKIRKTRKTKRREEWEGRQIDN